MAKENAVVKEEERIANGVSVLGEQIADGS
jgi:hypothetical protein